MVGLAGPTGCGKSTVTSLVVAREDVRAHFRDGIVWLPVRGKGAEHRLPDLMLLLANMVYETVLKSGEASWSSKKLRPPRTPGGVACDRENGAAYIRGALGITRPGGEEGDGGGESHEQRRWRPRYLIVADDVYEPEVLEELQGIGAWVLYTTTRSASFIRRNGERSEGDGDGDGDGGDHADVLRLDNISDAEGETVLRRASGLDPEAELPQPALDLFKSYGSVVMDLAYIGRWGVVHGTTDVKAWEVALNSVFLEGGEGGQEWTRRRWHTAVLFAGMADLARLNDKAKDLYLSLAVLPKGLSFTPADAAALLFGGDTKAAKAATPDLGAVMEVLGVLEQCSVLFLEEGGRYCMHGSHADFVRELISCFPLSRKRALGRWREHASTPAALFAWPVEDSVRIQWALSSLDDAVEPPPPYDAMLDGMDQSDADTFSAVLERVAQVQALAGNLEGAHAKYTRLVVVTESRLEREAAGGGDSISQAGAELLLADRLHNLGMIAGGLGSTEEAFACHGRARSIREERLGASHPDAAHSLQALAACAAAAGKPQDEEWYLRRALSSWTGEGEDGEGGGDGGGGDGGSVDLLDRWDVARTLHTLGGNSLKAGRTGEATELFRRALRWWEDALGQGCTNAARALHSLGVCAYDAGEVGEAAEFYRRALKVRVERLGPRHPDVAVTMHSLGVCEWKAGRPDEAEVLYQQTLSIRVEALGVEHPHVARTLHSLGGCARHAGRDGDAMALYQRALDIQEAMLGPCHPEVAATLHEMGVSAFGAGRMEQAESHFRRALSIKELTAGAAGSPGTFTLDMAYTLHDLGGVIFAFGDSRVAEAEEVFQRALEIRESLEASLDAASTLQCLAECARARGSGDGGLVSDNRSSSDGGRGGGSGGSAASQEGGVRQRLEEGFLRRALAIQEKELGRDHVYVAYTLFQLGRCLCSAAPAAGNGPKTEEGLAAFARSLEVRERELGRNHEDVLRTLHYLAACVSAAGRVGEAAEYYRRAVATEELTLGAEHPSVARSLHLFGACVLKAGRIDEGIELLRRALAIPEKQEQEQEQEEGVEEKKAGGNSSWSGDHHLDVALTMQQVAVCAADAGRTEDADALFREVLAIEERKLGADHLENPPQTWGRAN
ncbi:TPR repeat-containing protein [Ectocarpus siliculosus]|uniref:TPR repeat-containing protein n=1 Tax=Ectocarpus siliculosus TaxID=2880 RepID=D7G2X0_ECTSI|nr:TPR repeat-containing protein [Ectocarpus siliculosus]|eukprot:CBJ48827.1 TPR repeat-containing protein [Ectocarpus siliculosus]